MVAFVSNSTSSVPISRSNGARSSTGPCLPARSLPCGATSRRTRAGKAQASRDARTAGVSLSLPSTSAWPKQLLSNYCNKQDGTPPLESEQLTVYSCRFTTGNGRGADLSDPMSGVNLCLIGRDGRAVLHRISPLHDPATAHEEVAAMCQIIGGQEGVGADCRQVQQQSSNDSNSSSHSSGSSQASSSSGQQGSGSFTGRQPSPPSQGPSSSSSSITSYSRPPKPAPLPRFRFQAGHVDEVVFLAPELGPLAAVLVGTEQGSWLLDELQVSSSRTHHIDRFVCRRQLGAQVGLGAAFLQPVPPGAVVYGSGEAAVLLSKEQAKALHSLDMSAYDALKQRLLTTTAVLTASGTAVAALTSGLDGAVPFAVGGMAGIVYQFLLQQGVDSIVVTATPLPVEASSTTETPEAAAEATAGEPVPNNEAAVQSMVDKLLGRGKLDSTGPAAAFRHVLSQPAVRVTFLAGVALAGAVLLGMDPGHPGSVPGSEQVLQLPRTGLWRLLVGTLGFLTYKVALISVAVSTPVAAEPVKTRVP